MNEKKPLKSEYDQVFSDAYFKTMAEAEHLEWKKNRLDKVEILAEMFEKDLFYKDLTDSERKDLVSRFKQHIQFEDQKREHELTNKAKKKKKLLMGLVAVLTVVGLLYVYSYRPFTSKLEVREKLAFYTEKVDQGYGTYSLKFYDSLDTYSLKFNELETTKLRQDMYRELDEKFADLIVKLEAGEIRFYDDAQEWASYFPNPEERKAREQAADNAFSKGMGKAIDEGINKLIKGTGSFIQRILGFFKND